MRALEHGASPGLLHEIQRDNVRITKELVAHQIDPPREFPLVGPAQLSRARWKCTINFTEVTRVGWPIPRSKMRRLRK